MMKRLLLPFTLPLLLAACTTLTPDQARLVDDAAIILKSATRDGCAIAIASDTKNRDYIKLAVNVLDTFIVGSDYSPGALSKALQPVLKAASDLKVQLAINTAIDLYELFFGRYVKDQIARHEAALKLLNAIHDGAVEALGFDKMKLRAVTGKPQ